MSFLSFYNDHHGAGGEALLKTIRSGDWEQADFTARTDPLHVRWKVNIPGFYDGKQAAKVYPLHLACINKPNPKFITTLHSICPKAGMSADSAYKRTPLHLACMYSAPPESVALLIKLSSGAVKKKDGLGRLPIHYAAKNPKLENSIAVLLKAYPGSAKVADKQGFLPIHVACRCGMSVSVIRMLIRSAPKTLKMKTKKGSTPLMCAKLMKGPHKEEVLGLLMRATASGGVDLADDTGTNSDSLSDI